MMRLCVAALLALALSGFATAAPVESGQIVVGSGATDIEKYAANELQRYLYQLSGRLLPIVSDSSAINRASFIVGQESTNKCIAAFRKSGQIPAWKVNAATDLLKDDDKWGFTGDSSVSNETQNAGYLDEPGDNTPFIRDGVPIFEIRYNPGGYWFKVPNGRYKVTLHFAEIQVMDAYGRSAIWDPNNRVFDVLINGKTRIEALDLFAKKFCFVPDTYTFDDVDVNDGLLKIDFKSRVGDPIVSAIEVDGPNYHKKVNCGYARRVTSKGVWEADQPYPGDRPRTPTPEDGFTLKQFDYKGKPVLAVAGNDPQGVLYGVYTLLSDYYGIGFFFSGDVFPEKSWKLDMPKVDLGLAPRQKIRGFLSWTNFPQSLTSYSIQDYRFIIDQMARQRMNFLFIHDYDGRFRHNEMFLNPEYNGVLPRVAFPTAKHSHGWMGVDCNIRDYPFRSGDLFDDYDFGSDASIHNENLDNREVMDKGVTLLQQVIAYAHSRGVRIGLGTDLNEYPAYYYCEPGDPGLAQARADQVIRDYPDLDYYIPFRGESIWSGTDNTWERIFEVVYKRMKEKAPHIKLALSGWGLEARTLKNIPTDLVITPQSPSEALACTGKEYPGREYWGMPWTEKDHRGSQWFYSYWVDLSQSIGTYHRQNENMNGWLAMCWKISDVTDPKMWWFAAAPWDLENKLYSSKDVYHRYAETCYGKEATDAITEIINENEPFAPEKGESNPGCYQWTGAYRPEQIEKAKAQLGVIDGVIAKTTNAEYRHRLEQVRARIENEKMMNEIDAAWPKVTWEQMPLGWDRFVDDFMTRVSDLSTLGNLMSLSNRQSWFGVVGKEKELRAQQTIKSPSYVEARGTKNGAVITWRNEHPTRVTGFNVYRNGGKIGQSPAGSNSFTDKANGSFSYQVTAVVDAGESPKSLPSTCQAGTADNDAPKLFVISPPTSVDKGKDADILVRVLDNRTYDSIEATLHYRPLNAKLYSHIVMTRRAKAIFGARIPGAKIPEIGIEYWITATDGRNMGYYPLRAPDITASVAVAPAQGSAPGKVASARANGQKLTWQPVASAFQYRIYRSKDAKFEPGPASYLTYVGPRTTSFNDDQNDFGDNPKCGDYYYRVTAIDRLGREGAASPACSVSFVGSPTQR